VLAIKRLLTASHGYKNQIADKTKRREVKLAAVRRFALKGAEFFEIILTYVRHPVWSVSIYC
jgi:hypothetical protein